VNELGRAFPFLWLSIRRVAAEVRVRVLLPSGSLERADGARFGQVLPKVALRSVNRVFDF